VIFKQGLDVTMVTTSVTTFLIGCWKQRT